MEPQISMFSITLVTSILAIVFFVAFLNELVRSKKFQKKLWEKDYLLSQCKIWSRKYEYGDINKEIFVKKIQNISNQ